MHRFFVSAALCGALLLGIAAGAADRDATAQEIAELQKAVDSGDLDAAEDLLGTYFFKEVGGTAIDVQTMRLRYFRKAFDDAFTIAERILAADPRNTDALNMRGLVKAERKDPAGAIAEFDAAIASNPAYGKAHFNRAVQLCAQRRFDEADMAYDAARERLPDKASVFDTQFVCHLAAGRIERATEVANAWFASGASYQMLARLSQAERAAGEHDKAYRTWLKALAMYGSNNDFRSFTSRVFLDIGTPELALKTINEQIADAPTNRNLYLDRGEAYDGLGRDDEALADYDHGFSTIAGEPPPKRARQMALRGFIKLERGDNLGAASDFDTAVHFDAADPVGWFGRGEVLSRVGKYDSAIPAYESALKILPDDKTYQAALAKAQAAKK